MRYMVNFQESLTVARWILIAILPLYTTIVIVNIKYGGTWQPVARENAVTREQFQRGRIVVSWSLEIFFSYIL